MSEVAAAALADAPTADKLDQLREHVRRQRDLEAEIRDLTEQLERAGSQLLKLQREELPELFNAAGVDRVGLPAEGNHPAYDAELRPFYKANIEAGWDEPRRAAGFAYLEERGASDLVRTEITVSLGRGERKLAERVRRGLDKAGVPYSEKLSVPWNTLTAWLRERVEKHKEVPDLEAIGGFVGEVVRLVERKEKL